MTTQTFTLTLELPFVCPACHDPVGFLYPEDGLCLGCHLDWQDAAILEYEEREAGEWGAESMQVCGID